MDTFRPSFSFWPPPEFLGDSSEGLTAWIGRRDRAEDRKEDRKLEQQRLELIRQIVEDHHDNHARTIYPVR
jgi:hypothetical protein